MFAYPGWVCELSFFRFKWGAGACCLECVTGRTAGSSPQPPQHPHRPVWDSQRPLLCWLYDVPGAHLSLQVYLRCQHFVCDDWTVLLLNILLGVLPSYHCGGRKLKLFMYFKYYIYCCYCLVSKLCPTLGDSMDCNSPPGSFIHGIFQVRTLEWVAFCFFKGSSQPRAWTRVSCLVGRFLYTMPQLWFCSVGLALVWMEKRSLLVRRTHDWGQDGWNARGWYSAKALHLGD